jgi:hypothetical protein
MPIATVILWIVVGGANRIVVAAPELIGGGGVTSAEAFKLLATEWGRRVRYCAEEVVLAWARS